jgi:2,3-bisphosphoglycerate-independent phosphoglycerate mutase
MKYILVAIPGASDHPSEELGGKTPLEVAKIPNLHSFAKMGKVGQVKLVSERLEPSSDVTFLNLLGFDADRVYTGLGPLEAANLELKLEENEIPFRMNFITEAGGLLADPTAGDITTKEAKALINFLNKKVASDFVRFFAGSHYRHIAVLKDAHGFEALSAKTVPPDAIVGERLDSHLPKGPGSELLKKLMYDAKLLLQDHEINQVRVDLEENPANMIWLWGQGRRPKLKKFSEMFGFSGAVVTSTEFAKGIARLAGLTVLEVDGLGDLSANYEKKTKLLLDALEEMDFVCVYVQDCDDAAWHGDLRAKISAIEAADFFILSKIKNYLEASKDVRVLATPCHTTPWKMKKRVRDFVPFVIAGKNVMPDDSEKFSESAARISEMKINKSSELMPLFLAK